MNTEKAIKCGWCGKKDAITSGQFTQDFACEDHLNKPPKGMGGFGIYLWEKKHGKLD